MKVLRSAGVLILSVVMLSCKHGSLEPKDPPVIAGLIASYKFSANTKDSSGHNFHGTMKNAGYASDRFGRPDRALRLNGLAASGVSVQHNIAFNKLPQSISFWFRTDAQGPSAWLLGKMALPDSKGYGIRLRNGILEYVAYDSLVLRADFRQDNKWHHAVISLDRTSSSLYIDGDFRDGSKNDPWVIVPLATAADLTLGYLPNDPGTPLAGELDDILIYDRILNADQVQDLYHQGGWDVETPDSSLPVSLTAYYPFSGNANDAGGNNLHGQISGAGLGTDRYGAKDKAFSFGTGGTITIPHNAAFNDIPQTICFWIQIDTEANPYAMIMGKGSSSLTGNYRVYLYNGYLRYAYTAVSNGVQQGAIVSYNAAFPQDKGWHHVAITAGRQKVSVYIDGVLASGEKQTPSHKGNLNDETGPLIIGDAENEFLPPLEGKLDELRFYRGILTANEIRQLAK